MLTDSELISINWTDEARSTIMVHLPACWTGEEFSHTYATVHTMMREVPHMVHLITQLPPKFVIPPQFLLRLPAIVGEIPPNSGVHAVVGGGKLAHTLFHIVRRVHPQIVSRVILVDRVEDAYAHLATR